MPLITTLTIPNPGPLISTFVRIQYTENEYGFDIDAIELYHDAACKKIATEFSVDELPRETQDRIYTAIYYQRDRDARSRGMRRLKAALEADLYAKRLMDGARA